MKFPAPRAAARAFRLSFRTHASAHVAMAIFVGAVAGLCVIAMTALAEAMHVLFYGIAFDQRLSAQAHVGLPAALAALCGGGLVLGLVDQWRRRRNAPPTVDPVEANACGLRRDARRPGCAADGRLLCI